MVAKKEAKAPQKKSEEKQKKSSPKKFKFLKKVLIIFAPFRPFGRYVKGAWQELRQVTWPNRKTSIQLTIAVILFTAVMSGLIVALDFGFEQLVKRILL